MSESKKPLYAIGFSESHRARPPHSTAIIAAITHSLLIRIDHRHRLVRLRHILVGYRGIIGAAPVSIRLSIDRGRGPVGNNSPRKSPVISIVISPVISIVIPPAVMVESYPIHTHSPTVRVAILHHYSRQNTKTDSVQCCFSIRQQYPFPLAFFVTRRFIFYHDFILLTLIFLSTDSYRQINSPLYPPKFSI